MQQGDYSNFVSMTSTENKSGPVALCRPIALVLLPKYFQSFCHRCLFAFEPPRLLRCGACSVVWYCSTECQKKDWKDIHKLECKYLKGKANVLTAKASEIDIPSAWLLMRLLLKHESGQLEHAQGDFSGKTFANLMTHREEMQADPAQMKRFRRLRDFIFFALLSRDACDNEDVLFDIFAKMDVSSYSIDVWHKFNHSKFITIGKTLSFDLSAYDHSCRPTAFVYFCGREMFVISLDPANNAFDPSTTFIAYIGLLQTTEERRNRLQRDWYFWCECSRCIDPTSDVLSAISCQKCSSAVIPFQLDSYDKISKTSLNNPKSQETTQTTPRCQSCNDLQPSSWLAQCAKMEEMALDFLHSSTVAPEPSTKAAKLEECQTILAKISPFLPKSNLSHADLISMCGILSDDNQVKAECQLHFYQVWQACYPKHYGGIFLQIGLETAHALATARRFDEAAEILSEINDSVRLCFIRGECPFRARLTHLEACIAKRIPACETLSWEFLELMKDPEELRAIISADPLGKVLKNITIK